MRSPTGSRRIATVVRPGRRTRSHQRIREGSSMGQKTVRFSDLSGQLIMHDDELATARTWTGMLRPEIASKVMVPVWPAATLAASDSAKETTVWNALSLISVMKPPLPAPVLPEPVEGRRAVVPGASAPELAVAGLTLSPAWAVTLVT